MEWQRKECILWCELHTATIFVCFHQTETRTQQGVTVSSDEILLRSAIFIPDANCKGDNPLSRGEEQESLWRFCDLPWKAIALSLPSISESKLDREKKNSKNACHILSTICLDRKNNSLLPPQLIPHQWTLPQTRHSTSAIWDPFHQCCNELLYAVCTHCKMYRSQEQGVGNLGTHSCDEASSV